MTKYGSLKEAQQRVCENNGKMLIGNIRQVFIYTQSEHGMNKIQYLSEMLKQTPEIFRS